MEAAQPSPPFRLQETTPRRLGARWRWGCLLVPEACSRLEAAPGHQLLRGSRISSRSTERFRFSPRLRISRALRLNPSLRLNLSLNGELCSQVDNRSRNLNPFNLDSYNRQPDNLNGHPARSTIHPMVVRQASTGTGRAIKRTRPPGIMRQTSRSLSSSTGAMRHLSTRPGETRDR